jgi:hypothetical protein
MDDWSFIKAADHAPESLQETDPYQSLTRTLRDMLQS